MSYNPEPTRVVIDATGKVTHVPNEKHRPDELSTAEAAEKAAQEAAAKAQAKAPAPAAPAPQAPSAPNVDGNTPDAGGAPQA